jgi:hypothetical protein
VLPGTTNDVYMRRGTGRGTAFLSPKSTTRDFICTIIFKKFE